VRISFADMGQNRIRGNDMEDLISRKSAIEAINGMIDRFERILADIRESKGDDSVCGMCEYDGAYMGQSGDWCNECPGFDKDDCFKLSDKCRKRWMGEIALQLAAPSTAHTTETTAETTAPSTDDWIPVERELPDDLEEVNVTYVNRDPEPYYAFLKDKPFTASAVYYKGKWYWYSSVCVDVLAEYGRNDVDKVDDAIEITAWKPLPGPYRGGEK